MEAACRRASEILQFRPLCTPHPVAVMVVALAFHTKDPDRVGDTLNIFLFPDLSPSAGSEAALLTRKWDVILGGGTLTSFVDTILLMGEQKVAPIAEWDEAESQIEAWAVFCTLFLGYNKVNPAAYKMLILLEDTSGVIPRMRAQAHQKTTSPTALFRLI